MIVHGTGVEIVQSVTITLWHRLIHYLLQGWETVREEKGNNRVKLPVGSPVGEITG